MPLDYNFTSKVADALHKENPDAFVSEEWSRNTNSDNGLPFSAEISLKNKIVNVMMECNNEKKIQGKQECKLAFEMTKLTKNEAFESFQKVFPKTTTKYSFITK